MRNKGCAFELQREETKWQTVYSANRGYAVFDVLFLPKSPKQLTPTVTDLTGSFGNDREEDMGILFFG